MATAVPAAAQVNEDQKLVPNDGDVLDAFGLAVAVSGGRAVVGALYDDDKGVDSGSAYVFDLASGQQLWKLQPGDGAAGDEFGFSVAVDGGLAVVGAYANDDFGSGSGSAYIFDVTNGQEIWKLLPADGEAADNFGYSVAVQGATALVGAWWDDDKGSQSGSVYVFDATTGQQLGKLVAGDGAEFDRFGASVGLSGTTAIVGAPGDDDNGAGSGSAYLFDVTTGQQLQKILPNDGSTSDAFGVSVDVRGERAVVGADMDDDNGIDSGAAYLFDVSSGQQVAKLLPADGKGADRFGLSVGIDAEAVIAGSFLHDDGATDAGAAYLFDATTGQELAKLLPSDGAADDYFGWAVAIDDGAAVVGAIADDDNGAASGSAYAFALPSDCGVTYCGAAQNPNNVAGITVDTCDSASPSIVVALSGGPPNQFVYLLVGDGGGTVSQPPGAKGDLCVVGGACLGRYDKDVGQIDGAGAYALDIRNAVSSPCQGGVAIAPGATWNFQFWHRQPMGQPATFSEAISVTFD